MNWCTGSFRSCGAGSEWICRGSESWCMHGRTGRPGPAMSPREQILTIVRRALDRGQTVEIDGLGTFRPKDHGHGAAAMNWSPGPSRRCSWRTWRRIWRWRGGCGTGSRRPGCAPWMDKDKLLPGQNWPRAIRRAVEISDAFVACFSPRSIAKRGQFHNELRWALECAQLLPLEATFLVPVRFEACAVPRRIAEQVQYVDLFPDWDAGVKKVVRAVKAGRASRTYARLQAD